MVILFPFLAAALWALHYTLAERVLASVSIPCFYLISGVLTVVVSLLFYIVAPERYSLSEFSTLAQQLKTEKGMVLMLVIALATCTLADLCTLVSIRDISATFAAIGEISYPLFIPLFAWVLFKDNQLSPSIVAGGLMIFLGIGVLLYGEQFNAHKIAQQMTVKQPPTVIMPTRLVAQSP